jgi:Sigma-70 factor, region 1.2
MTQRGSQAVRRRAAVRQRLETVTARQGGTRPPLPEAPVLDADGVDAGLGEEVVLDLWWQSADVPETVVEALVTEGPSRREPTAVVDDESTTGTEWLIRLYLQEIGTVSLLTAADEVRLAEQLHTAKARLLEGLQAALPAAAISPRGAGPDGPLLPDAGGGVPADGPGVRQNPEDRGDRRGLRTDEPVTSTGVWQGGEGRHSLVGVVVGEGGAAGAVRGGSVPEDTHGAGAAADLAEASLDGMGGAEPLARLERRIAPAGEELIEVIA